MSESIDLEALSDVLNRLANVGTRVETMARAIGTFDGGVDLPAGVDLSGISLTLRSLEGVFRQTADEFQSLRKTAQTAVTADKSWGDHVKGWLTPSKTGHHSLDAVFGAPASVGAGATDAVHDVGAGIVGLALDFNPVTNVNAFRQGQTMPIQQPGLGLINLAVHPLDSAKGVVGWQYHNDPMRFTAFAGTNLFAMIATGGLGELGEAGMAARLSRLAEIGTGTSGARIAAEIDRLAARLDELPASRQRNPAKRKWVRSQRRDATRDLADANDRLKALQASHAERVARLQAAADRLKALRDNRGVRAVADAQTLYLASLIRKIPGGRRVWTLARVALEEYLELSSMGDAGQKHDAPVRQRLRDLAAAHPGSVHA